MKKIHPLFFLILLSLTCKGWSWNDSGHRQVAYLAYDLLDSTARLKIIELIKQHPRYAQDFVARRPGNFDAWTRDDQQRWTFSQIAVWPDEVRRIADEDEQATYNRPQWHYINFPIFPSDELEKSYPGSILANLNTEAQNLQPESNIAQVLNFIDKDFKQPDPALPQAVQLCWLFHLVGDIHQPLHSSALFTPNKLRRGDRGGGLIKISKSNLHRAWDGAGGLSSNAAELKRRARQLRQNETLAVVGETAAADLNFIHWLEESHELATTHAYGRKINRRNTILDAAALYDANRAKTFRIKLSREYKNNMENVARERLAAAGYRLAALLQSGRYF